MIENRSDHYQSIIANYPLFSLLSAKNINELLLIAKEKRFDVSELITNEGDIVDSVYLIVSGTAEVTRTITTVEMSKTMHIATLKKGDAIGLAETGFFSHRGIRTASITTSTPTVLLEFKLEDFQKFLRRPGIAYPGLRSAGDKIMLMNFIRKSIHFKNYSVDQIHHLARKIKKISVPAETMIFKEGDTAQEYYCLLSGVIALSSAAGKEKTFYEAYSILGENEFISGQPYQSSAHTVTPCEMFILDKKSMVTVDAYQQGLFHTLLCQFKKLWVK